MAELGCQDAPGLGGARRAMASVMLLDSGVGGLSVLDELRSRLPEVDYSYVLDNALNLACASFLTSLISEIKISFP